MQLGARWRVGDPPHHSVPPSLHEAITAQENAHPDAVSWTLTWLEGRPQCALDDLAIVTLDASGRLALISVGQEHPVAGADADDDDWLN